VPHPFEIQCEITVDATPDQVWAAITNGAQLDSWFMGSSEVEPRLGGTIKSDVGDFVMESKITAWEPGKRLRNESETGPDGRFMAFEYQIEGRGGKTLVRLVHSGFLAEGWEMEYAALQEGDPMYLRKLAAYLNHFVGRVATRNHFVNGPQFSGHEAAMARLTGALGLSATPTIGDPVHARLEGLPPIDGVVDELTGDFLGVRTGDGLYRFMHNEPFGGQTLVEHHDFSSPPTATKEAWQAWLAKTFA
jgi:uncharacterized protein YndB with AHSA1/START domain